jgi:sigma-B regulation protein RsbU (phosphoserine phosphatase)
MEALPPVRLGAFILAAYGIALTLRFPLQRRLVETAADERQPRRQFALDLGLGLMAGVTGGAMFHLWLDFPLGSSISLLIGTVVQGFFMGLDMSLARERSIISAALTSGASYHQIPPRLYSMTSRFSLVAFAASLFVVVILILAISRDFAWLAGIERTPEALEEARRSVILEVLFITAVLLLMVLNLILSYSRNLRLLFHNQTGVLERVSQGDLSQLVPVVTSDEFGFIAGHTNSMIHGLRHRTELISDLKLAEEVQQNLLPRHAPHLKDLDLAGISLYCRETGGDYFDYLQLPGHRLGVLVADAADHGIGSALYMTSARAYLLACARAGYTGPSRLLMEVNRFLVDDSQETGRFMTALLLEVDLAAGRLCWTRAGHEPALLYDPQQDRFETLAGEGAALGVSDTIVLEDRQLRRWSAGSLVLLGTDGIGEARNLAGAMFGYDRLRAILRQVHARPARAILDAVNAAVTEFRGGAPQEDDITMVALRLLRPARG